MKLLSLFALVALSSFGQDGYDPVPVERPKAPGRGKAEIIVVPSAGELGRDAAIADRFTAEGQKVTYLLRAREGELSLLTLDTLGFARGWQSGARVRILNSKTGEVLSDRTREGGTVYRMFLPFEAPEQGLFQVELSCPKQFYRYVLTRNSQFRTRGEIPIAIGERRGLHGYLSNPKTDVARYSLQLAENQEVLLNVLSDETPARQEDYGKRQKAADSGHLDLLRGERMPAVPNAKRGGAARGATLGDHPDFFLRVLSEGTELVPPTPFSRFRAPKAGTFIVEVLSNTPGEGGFFELGVDHAPNMVAGTGFVDDAEGDPVAGIELQFFREPGLDFLGRTTTNDEGQWTLQLPAAPYTVFLQARSGGRMNVRTTVDAGRETNFIFGGKTNAPMDK